MLHVLELWEEEFGEDYEDYIPTNVTLPYCLECLLGSYHEFTTNKCIANPLTTADTFVENCAFYRTDNVDTVTCSLC